MKRFVATLMLLFWSVSITDAALAHVHLTYNGLDGVRGIEHVDITDVLNLEGSGHHRHDDSAPDETTTAHEQCSSHVAIQFCSEVYLGAPAAAVPLPSEKPVPPVLFAQLKPLKSDSSGAIFLAKSGPTRFSPHLISHRSVVILT